jgi:4-amino-4-deoxy-L-arabinose transferase-like glycosyltransferase
VSDERPLPRWLPTVGIAVALVGLVALSFAERWAMLDQSPFPVGVDGYYYPVQLRALLESGGLVYPSTPLAFWLMAPLAAATDPITGAKLGAALFGALIALPAYGVGARLGRCRGAGLIAAVLATTSAGSAFLTIEFVKNGIGLTVLMTALWLLLRALETPSRWQIVGALVGAAATVLAHKMAASLLLVIATPAMLAAAAGHGKLRGRRLLYAILIVGGTAALFVGLALGGVLPMPNDLDLRSAIAGDATHWDAPALVTRTVTLTFGHEALIGAVLGIAGAFVLANRRAIDRIVPPAQIRGEPTRRSVPGETAVAFAIFVIAIAIAWPTFDVTDAQGLGFRLRVAAFVPMSLAAAVVVGRLASRVKHRDFVLAVAAFALATRTPGQRTEGRIDAHPAMVAAVQALHVPDGDTAVVPERHIVFMVAWYTRARVQIRPEGSDPAHRWRLLPLAWTGLGSPLDKALTAARTGPHPPIGLHPRHPNGLVLVPEETYQRVLESIPAGARTAWSRWRTI